MSADCRVFDDVFCLAEADSSPGLITSFCHIKLGGSTAYVLVINYRELILLKKCDNNLISTHDAPEQDTPNIENCVTFPITNPSINTNRTLRTLKNTLKPLCWYPRSRS
jgi:hypothetical protein